MTSQGAAKGILCLSLVVFALSPPRAEASTYQIRFKNNTQIPLTISYSSSKCLTPTSFPQQTLQPNALGSPTTYTIASNGSSPCYSSSASLILSFGGPSEGSTFSVQALFSIVNGQLMPTFRENSHFSQPANGIITITNLP